MKSRILSVFVTVLVPVALLAGLYYALLYYALTPTTAPVQHHYHGIDTLILTLDAEAPLTAPAWAEEVSRRFPDALIVISHGGSVIGEWVMVMPGGVAKTTDVALSLTKAYPGRDIVLIVCNPGHHVIDIPNVHYALDDVWKYPDRHVTEEQVGRSQEFPEGIGNIYEFR